MTDRSNYQKVGVDVDEQSFGQLTQRINAARDQIAQLRGVNQSLADTAQDAGTRLHQAFQSIKPSIDSNISSIQELRVQLTGAATDAGNLGKQVNDGGGGDSGGGVGIAGARRTGAFLNRIGLPEIGQPLQIIGGLQSVDKTLESLGTSAEALVSKGGAATEVIQALGGDLGVVAVSGGLAVLALGAIAAAGAVFKAELDDASKGLGDAVTKVDDYYKAIEKGTTDSINAQIKAADLDKTIQEEKVKTLQAAYDAAHPKPQTADAESADIGAALTSIFSDVSGGGKQLNKDLEDSKKALNDTSINIEALKAALGDTTVASNDAAIAEQKLQDARDKTADKNIQQAQQTAQLEATGTTKQIQDRLTAIQVERDAVNKQIEAGGLSAAEIQKLNQQLRDLGAEAERDSVVIGPAIAAREKEIAAIENASKAVTDHANAIDKQNQAEVTAVEKYNKDVQSAEDSATQARITVNDKLQNALVSAAEKAVEDANKALDQLTQKRQDNLISLTRDEDKITRDAADQQINDQIKAQTQERDDLQTHLQNLKQIREADAGRQRDDLLNRNYRDLFSLSEQKTQDVNKENDRYTQQEQQRQEALQIQEGDQARAIQIQRRERLIAYQNSNEDALKQYNIEIQTANQAKQKAIQLAQQANQKELAVINAGLIQKEALLKQDAINTIRLTQQTADARAQIFNNELQQANALLGQGSLTNSGGAVRSGRSTPTPFADGGYASVGQLTKVNDKYGGQRESFNGVPFPPGLGLFIPMQSGQISSGGGGQVSVSIPITINGVQDPSAMGRMIDQHLEQKVPAQVRKIMRIP